jgi:hypothetical protein
MALGRLTRGEQRFFVGTTEAIGVQTANISYIVNEYPTRYIGMKNYDGDRHPQGPWGGNASVSMLQMTSGEDPFLQHTGAGGFNGYILNGENSDKPERNFSFISGYLTSYGVSFEMGQLPAINAGITIFGEVGKIDPAELPVGKESITKPAFRIPDPGALDMSLSSAQIDKNRVTACDFSISCPRNPIYSLGNKMPHSVIQGGPAEITCNFTIELDEYQAKKASSFPCDNTKNDLTFTVKEKHSDTPLVTYTLRNMFLKSENYTAAVEGPVIMQAQYKGYMAVFNN